MENKYANRKLRKGGGVVGGCNYVQDIIGITLIVALHTRWPNHYSPTWCEG